MLRACGNHQTETNGKSRSNVTVLGATMNRATSSARFTDGHTDSSVQERCAGVFSGVDWRPAFRGSSTECLGVQPHALPQGPLKPKPETPKP